MLVSMRFPVVTLRTTSLPSLPLLAMLAVTTFACGGKVTVEESAGGQGAGAGSSTGASGSGASGSGASGTGGSGNSGATGTGTGTITSTSTDTGVGVCDCDLFCDTILGCGFELPQDCGSICDQVPQQAKDCACQADTCQEIAQECFGQGGGGPGGGGPGGGGPGGPVAECFDCINEVGIFGCEPAIDQCLSNPSCEAILDCHGGCGWTPQCNAQCDAQNPMGALEFAILMECVACNSCFGECQQTPIGDYCF